MSVKVAFKRTGIDISCYIFHRYFKAFSCRSAATSKAKIMGRVLTRKKQQWNLVLALKLLGKNKAMKQEICESCQKFPEEHSLGIIKVK